MNALKMLSRIARYDYSKLISLFNSVCDSAGMPDVERKVVFDAQADYVGFFSGHREGVKMSPDVFLRLINKPVEMKTLPDDLQKRFINAQKILWKYDVKGEEIIEAATCSIIKMYSNGGVFKKK